MTKDETITRRILMSYKLMLDFYGMRLEDEATGLISRSNNYAVQYRNLCSTCSCPNLVPQSEPRSSGRLVVRVTGASAASKSYLIRPFTSYTQ